MTNTQNNSADKFADAAQPVNPSRIVVYQDKKDPDHIRIENLSVHIPGHTEALVGDVNMKIRRGERVLVTGESGSGKTTLVKAILNLWNHGDGVVAMPEGVNVMTIPQYVYLPNVQLRSILNMKPEGQERFSDRALRDSLLAVNLGQLVQHIP
ncbi:MAG: ATP-binding cassette domain-containing protein, partial [Alphaproteobacteria bacterium]|nr:ATP-binding cassette domain-containing protein [Alphaproteobacteria bacterium]